MAARARLVPGVQLVHVQSDGEVLSVSVFGGEEAVMAELSFPIPDPLEHHRALRACTRWASEARPVTLVEGVDGVVTLVDDRDALNELSEG